MKIRNKQELQQTAFNHLSDIDCEDFMNFHKMIIMKNDNTFASGNSLHFRKNLLEKM